MPAINCRKFSLLRVIVVCFLIASMVVLLTACGDGTSNPEDHSGGHGSSGDDNGDDNGGGDDNGSGDGNDGGGWVDPDEIVPPVTGSESEWDIAAVALNGTHDNIRPMAVAIYDYYSNTTYGTYLGGTDDMNAGIYVFSYNHSTQTQTEPRGVYLFSDIVGSGFDAHSYPQIVRSFDGHIHIFFCDQSGDHNNVHIRFDERGTVESDFTTEIFHYGGSGLFSRDGTDLIRAEYPKAFVARDGTIYFFSRMVLGERDELSVTYDGETYRAALRPQIFIKSCDNGLTWEPAKVAIMRSNEVDYLTEPYLTQVIAEPDRDGIAQRFHFTWTLAAGIALWIDSGATVHSDYHNAHSKNIYHAYFVPGEDVFYGIDGTNLGESIIDEEMNDHCLVVETLGDVYTLPMTEAQYNETAGNNTSIMGNIVSIDNLGTVTVNGTFQWSGTSWDTVTQSMPGDARFMEWRDGAYYAYIGAAAMSTPHLDQAWNVVGGVGTEAYEASIPAPQLDAVTSVRAFAATAPAHPQARLWMKAYTGTRYGGFVTLSGHRSSFVPDRIVLEIEDGRVSPGDSVHVNAYVVDDLGARIMDADNAISLASSIGSFSSANIDANQGLGKSVFTVNASASPGEYTIDATSSGIDSGRVYLTVE